MLSVDLILLATRRKKKSRWRDDDTFIACTCVSLGGVARCQLNERRRRRKEPFLPPLLSLSLWLLKDAGCRTEKEECVTLRVSVGGGGGGGSHSVRGGFSPRASRQSSSSWIWDKSPEFAATGQKFVVNVSHKDWVKRRNWNMYACSIVRNTCSDGTVLEGEKNVFFLLFKCLRCKMQMHSFSCLFFLPSVAEYFATAAGRGGREGVMEFRRLFVAHTHTHAYCRSYLLF